MQTLTVKDVLAKMKWSRTTLDREIKAGHFPAPAKVARSLRFDAAEVDAALEAAFAQRQAHEAGQGAAA